MFDALFTLTFSRESVIEQLVTIVKQTFFTIRLQVRSAFDFFFMRIGKNNLKRIL